MGNLAIWLAGGLLSLFGALGYAELATAYPQEGGDYVYLSRAYGRWAGYLFGWIQLAIVRPGDIAVMAFAFAMYARTITTLWLTINSTQPTHLCSYSYRDSDRDKYSGRQREQVAAEYSYNHQGIGAAGYRRRGGRCTAGFVNDRDF